MSSTATKLTRFWRPTKLGGAEFVFGSYRHQTFPWHFHEEYVIAVMVSGVERLRHDDRTELVHAGNIILLNPGQVHENGAIDDRRFAYRTLYAPPSVVERALPNVSHRNRTLPTFAKSVVSDHEIFSGMLRLHSAVEAGEPTLLVHSLLFAGLARLFRHHGRTQQSHGVFSCSRREITFVRDYIDAKFAEDISLDDLSRLTGLSAYHLLRSFREEIGLPPYQYQLQRRVLHAMRRIRAGDSLASAAVDAGFVDQSHLNRHFKRILGVTPGRFRGSRKNIQYLRRRLN
ncbi:MAG: hypothetical protein DME22_12360 [Verrucomicrobia bacterium]|nr:MAG: hypothetical protein DME22_12360 [Verrucomicrobiota bacterium]PYJ97078.1 MAG: hypothetical protein DME23_17410 [Verrucomicrobiota bacterium]